MNAEDGDGMNGAKGGWEGGDPRSDPQPPYGLGALL